MNRLLIGAVGAVFITAVVAAGPAVAASDGEVIANEGVGSVVACASCHGADGLGNADIGAPMLAGMNADFLAHALRGFRDGSRVGPTMNAIAPDLTDAQIAAVTTYFAGLPAAPKHWEVDAALVEAGERLVTHGDWANGVPACVSCHGQHAEGTGATFPRLAGQLPAYLQARLDAWRDGTQKPQTQEEALMVAVAHKASAEELTAAVAYLASLSPDAGPVAGYPSLSLDWPQVSYNTKPIPAEIPWDKAAAAYEKQQKRMSRPDAYVHTPPSFDSLPDGPEGDLIRFGRHVFSNTQALRGTFTGNALACSNCHMGEGAHAEAAPVWATAVDFPQYRGKNKHVNTLSERIAGCFRFSMNGTPPPAQHKVMVALEAYMKWLGKGIPSDAVQKVRGYIIPPPPEKTPDFERGKAVFMERCATCHGADGQGRRNGERVVFPPLWGPESFNWGAGMHQIDKAAGFIKHNMPLGNPNLTDQQAWDVALFMDSHERPQDPRWLGDVAKTRNAFHNNVSTYGLKTANGLMGDIGAPLPKPEPLPFQNWATNWADPAE